MSQLILLPHPLTLKGKSTRLAEVRPGESLAQVLMRHDVDVSHGDWEVCIGGARVPALMWGRTQPRAGQVIECRRLAGNNDVARLVAFVALTYVTYGQGSGWIASYGAFAQAAVYVVGAMLINRMLPVQKARLESYSQATGSTYSLSGGRNRMRHYEALGLLFGTTKVVPDLAAQPYTWFAGDDQYLSMRFSAGLNTGTLATLLVGDTPLASFTDVVEMRKGFPADNTAFVDWANVDTVDGGLLDAPTGAGDWVERSTSPNTVRFALDLVANLYQMDSAGFMAAATVQVDIEYKLTGAGSWIDLGSYELRSTGTKPARVTVQSPTLAAGQYVVRARKFSINATGTRESNVTELQALKSYQADPTELAGYAQYGLRIKASGQLNGALDQLSWVGTQRATPVWNGAAFVTVPTSNPGAQMLQFARGLFDGEGRLQAGMGQADEDIDIEAFKAFTLHCTANGYTFDHWIDAPMSCRELMDAIAWVGFGSVSEHPGKTSVVWAAPDQPIECVVNMGNIKARSFAVEYVTRELAQELEVAYFDKAAGYKPRSLRILAPGVATPTETARLSPVGINTEADAARVGRFVMAQNVWQRKAVSWDMDLEHLTFKRLDIVALSHDLTQWGHGGRLHAAVNASGVVTLELDAEVPADSAMFVGLRIPGEKAYRVFEVEAFTGQAHSITLVEPWPVGVPFPGVPLVGGGANPAHDTIWIFDFKAQPGQRMRVTQITPGEDMKGAKITAVPEPDEFWDYVASGDYTAPGAPAAPPALVASNLVVAQRRLDLNYANGTELWLTFDVVGAFSTAQIWEGPEGDPLQMVGTTVVPRFGPLLVGNDGNVQLEVRPFDALGRPGTKVSLLYSVALDAVIAGADGADAELLKLQTSAQAFKFNGAGAAAPGSQTITLTALLANVTGTAIFVATLYDADGTSLGTATLGGSGNSRTLSHVAFGAASYAVVSATLGGLSDQATIVRLQDGADGDDGESNIVGWLTNEAHTVATAADGSGGSFGSAGGDFKVFDGLTELSSGITFSVVTSSGIDTMAIGTDGVYTLVGMTADLGTATLRAVVGPVTIDKVYTISRSKQGAAGSDAQGLRLLTTAQAFTYDAGGSPSPGTQTITFTAQLSNLSGTATWTAEGFDVAGTSLGALTLGGSGNTRTLTAANFGASAYAVVTATRSGFADQVSVVRIVTGFVDGPIPFSVEAVSELAPGSVPGSVTPAVAKFRLRTNGQSEINIPHSGTYTLTDNWHSSPGTGAGDDFKVKVLLLSGTLTSGTLNADLTLDTDREFTLSNSGTRFDYVEEEANLQLIFTAVGSNTVLAISYVRLFTAMDRT